MALPNLSQISEALDKIMPELTPVPVGTVAYAHEVPTGWLQCNGAAVSRTTYARLFKKIGTKYGAGDGSTTFNLPDLQHRVLEGTNTPSEVAQKVEAGLPDISGSFDSGQSSGVFWDATGAFTLVRPNAASSPKWESEESRSFKITMSAHDSNSTFGRVSSVQPSAIRLLPIVKF